MLESTAAGLSLIAESVSITQKKYGEISRIVTSLEKFLLAKYEPEVVEGYAGYSGLIARCEQAKNASLTSVLTTLQGDEQREVTLLKPFSLKLAGSFRTLESATSINEKSADNCIDVEITLNGEMFSPADTINYRVSDKVNLVLCKVAEVMVQYAEMKTLVHDDWLFSMGLNSPAVILSLSGKDKAAYRFRLIPIIMDAEKSIKIHKFKPSKCCVRPQNSVVVSQTSIVHNASIARMLCATSVVKQINDVADATPAFNETLKVLKVWKNRRLSKCLITGFNLAAMLAHICRIKSQAASKASTLELLKLFLTASPSLHSSAVFGEASQGQSTQNCLADFSLWADEHMNYDLLWNMQPAWSEFRDECTRALKLVFDVELMCKRKSELCDLYLKSVRDVKLAAWNLGDDEAGSSQIFSLLGNLSHDLFYVMGTSQLRGTHVRLSQDGDKGVCSVVVGVNLQSANLKLQESTTVGPNADTAVETEITKFREFWGHKASLLSMPNGTSAWAVSWPAGSELGKDCMRETTKSFTPSVPTQILRWICQNRFNSLLKVCPSMSVTDIPSADSSIERELHDVVISLQSRLATLRNCGVKEVSQISSRMRYTDIPPQLCTKTKWSADDSGLTDEDASQGSGVNFRTCVVDSNIVLSGNMNKWKLGDEEWVRHAKIGCLLSIQEELRDTTEFRLSVINKNDPFLEVYAPLSDKRTVAVRLRICTPIDEWPESHWITKGLAPVPKNVEEEDLPRKISQAQFLWYAPWLHQQIEACQTKFPAFVGTVRLLKLFVGAQRLSWDRHDFFWELLTLGAFQNAIRSSGKEKSDRNDVVIHTPNVGFYEVLKFIGDYEWTERPLIVLAANDSERRSCQQGFESAIRNSRPLCFVCTPKDPRCVLITTPTRTECKRMLSCVRKTVKLFEDKEFCLTSQDIENVLENGLMASDADILMRSPLSLIAPPKGLSKEVAKIKNLPTRLLPNSAHLLEPDADNAPRVDPAVLLNGAFDLCFSKHVRPYLQANRILSFRNPFHFPMPKIISLVKADPLTDQEIDKLATDLQGQASDLIQQLSIP